MEKICIFLSMEEHALFQEHWQAALEALGLGCHGLISVKSDVPLGSSTFLPVK